MSETTGLKTTRRPGGIYVASRASNPARSAMWRRLRTAGWPIISSWIDEAGEGETADFAELWMRIQREINGADGLIFYAEPADFPLKGALVEVGMALACNVPVAVVLPGVALDGRTMRPVGSWIMHPFVQTFICLDNALIAFAGKTNHAAA